MNETMKSGAQVYYTGDMANPSGHFKVTSVSMQSVTLKEIGRSPEVFGLIFRRRALKNLVGPFNRGTEQ